MTWARGSWVPSAWDPTAWEGWDVGVLGAYAAEHASALADLRAAGMPVTFSRRVPGVHAPATDTWTGPTATTITGAGIQKKGDPQRYLALGLVRASAVTLFAAPTDYGLRAYTSDFVVPGDTIEHNGVTLTVRDVDPNPAPDGIVIAATIVASV